MPVDSYRRSNVNGGPTVTRTITKQVVPFNTSNELVDPDVLVTKKHEEWTTSKKTVNHKTRQVETRIQRQLILEDGRVVADSGPQVTSKTKEDVRTEESENSEHKTSGDDEPGVGYTLVPGSAKVIREKTESTQTMTESKEENKRLHDESVRDLSGEELHQRIVVAPENGNFGDGFSNYPGVLTHYSSRSQKVVDKEEVKEVSQLKDGEMSTDTTRTHHHEEAYDDEVPEDEAEEGMVPERSAETSRKIQYYDDPKEFEYASEQLREESRKAHEIMRRPFASNGHHEEIPAVTHKWLNDHFVTSGDDSLEATRTRSGGNRITIEMTGHRSSPSDMSDNGRKHDNTSRESTFRKNQSYERDSWSKSPSPPVFQSSARSNPRATSSPFEVSSSSCSSRSKTPVKTFYLGEENTYSADTNSKKRHNKALADILKSHQSFEDSNHYGVHRNHSLSKNFSPKFGTTENGTFYAGPIYSNGIKSQPVTKNIHVTLSDDIDRYKTKSLSREPRSGSPHHVRLERSATTLPRNLKSNQYSKSLLIPISTPSAKHYKSSESLLSPNFSNYSSTFDYGSTNSFKYSDHRSSPVHNHSAVSTLRGPRHKEDWISSPYTDICSTNRSNRSNDYRSDSFRREDMRNSYEFGNENKRHDSMKLSYNGYSSPYRSKIPTSPPESGYQSPLPSSPPLSPPPRLVKIMNSDPYGSSGSSPPDSPHHTSSIRKSSAFPSGGTSRSKSSGDLRSSNLLLPSPTAFTPLSSPTELKTMGEDTNRQTCYRVKPTDDGRSVVVQVRDWQAR